MTGTGNDYRPLLWNRTVQGSTVMRHGKRTSLYYTALTWENPQNASQALLVCKKEKSIDVVSGWWWICGRKSLDSQEQLWEVRVGWLLCHSQRFANLWASQEMGREQTGRRGKAGCLNRKKSHLQSLHTSSNSSGGCLLGQCLSVGFRNVLGQVQEHLQLPQVLPGAGQQLSHMWRLREPSGCADPTARRGQGEDKRWQAQGKVSWGWSEMSRQHGLASGVWKWTLGPVEIQAKQGDTALNCHRPHFHTCSSYRNTRAKSLAVHSSSHTCTGRVSLPSFLPKHMSLW